MSACLLIMSIKFVMSMLIMWGSQTKIRNRLIMSMLIHLAQVQTYWRSKRCRQSMSIVSSNLLEIEEIKQHDTQGAWFRPWIQAATWHSVDKGSSSALNSNRWRARGEQHAGERANAVDGCNMFYLLETIIHFIHASSFYFDQELLQYCLQYESYFYNIWNYYFIILYNYILLFFIMFFILACSPLGGQARDKPRYPT
jgi:hypothetical protein